MVNIELALRVLAIFGGLLLLASCYYIDFNYLLAKLLLKKQQVNKIETNTVSNENDQFLQIIDLWYKLRNKCVAAKMEAALEKLDEVFPLLNKTETVTDTKAE